MLKKKQTLMIEFAKSFKIWFLANSWEETKTDVLQATPFHHYTKN